MIKLNLETNSEEQKLIKDFLELNVSDSLANKINNGVQILNDNTTVINKKNLNDFIVYASQEAQKLVEKNAKSTCVKSDTVFSWAIHFFEEDALKGKLYNEDGSLYSPKTNNRPKENNTNKALNIPKKQTHNYLYLI